MANKKNTKRALLLSALSLLLCVSMLVGSTFAWFTDSVTAEGNKIISGRLDVDLVDANGKSLENETLEFVDQDGNVLTNILWEPGCTYTLQPVKVMNRGNLWLKYEIVISGINGSAKLLEAIDWSVEGAELKGSLAPNGVTEALNITGHMKEEAGNEYQGLEMDGISITVYATQVNVEADSFGPDYDEVAPLLVWDGSVDTSWYDASATSYKLDTPAKLAGLAKLVNEGNNFEGKSIKLAADMDLNNLKWTAIGTSSANFNGKFYGNGYTIYNLNVSGTKGVGLIGFAGTAAHIEGVHIVGADVSGENSVGAVLGYGYLAKDCLKNCVVENAVVFAAAGANNDNGDKVGAVAGWTSNGNIIGNKAINCEIYGCRDIGGIVGYVNGENRAVEVSGNTVENVNVSVIDAEGYDANKLGTNINAAVGRTGDKVTVRDNNGEIKMDETVSAPTTDTELKAALKNNSTVVLAGDDFNLPSLSGKEGITLIGVDGAVIGGENASTGFGSNFGKNTTIKNITFSGKSNGVRWSYAQGGTSVFENCTFAGDGTYGFHIDQSNGATFIFNDCTFIGFNAFAGDLEKIEFNNCTFLSNGNYGNTNVWSVAYYNNCTWGEGAGMDIKAGTEIYVDGVRAASNVTSLKEVLSQDKDLVLLKDITFTGEKTADRGNYVEAYGNKIGFAQYSGVLDGNGKTLTDSEGDKSYVIVTHGGTIKNLTIKSGARGIVTYNPTEDVYIDSVVIDGPGYALNSTEQKAVDMFVTNSTINGWTSLAGFKSVSFTKCKLGENSTKYWGNMGYSADYDRLFRVYSPTTYTQCEFEQGYYLDLTAGGTATVIDCTVNGVEITAENYADYITIELPKDAALADCVTFG